MSWLLGAVVLVWLNFYFLVFCLDVSDDWWGFCVLLSLGWYFVVASWLGVDLIVVECCVPGILWVFLSECLGVASGVQLRFCFGLLVGLWLSCLAGIKGN